MTESNDIVVTDRKISVTFERRKDLGNYDSVTARAWVEDSVPQTATDAQVSEAAQALFNGVKAAVYDTLGIEVLMDEAGVIREKHEPAVTVKQAADRIGTQFQGTTESVRVMNANQYNEALPSGLVAKCNELGITAVWANKGKFGWFFKEALKAGDIPKNPDPSDPAKAGIIKFN